MIVIIAFTFGAGLMIYVVMDAIHSVIVHYREFLPAAQRFDEASARGDVAGMELARQQTSDAHEKSFNLLWWKTP